MKADRVRGRACSSQAASGRRWRATANGIKVPKGPRLVFCSGQLGVDRDDVVANTSEGQAERCLESVKPILSEAGLQDIMRINAYVTACDHMRGYMEARDHHINDPPPASNLMIVSRFARPEFLAEVEVAAAKAD